MAKRKIIESQTNKILRTKAAPVEKIDKTILALLEDLTDTLKDVGGAGLSAPQVGISLRLAVIKKGAGFIHLINPIIVTSEGAQKCFEGCLSLPGVFSKVKRPAKVVVKALDEHGNTFYLKGEKKLACTLCHEIDHLEGVLIIDKAEL